MRGNYNLYYEKKKPLFLKGELEMKSFLYFIVGLLVLPIMAFNKVKEIGEIEVSNYMFYKRLNTNLKREAKAKKA